MRTIPLIQDLFKVLHLFSHCSFDRSFHAVFWHIHSLCILKATTKRRIGTWIRSTRFYRNGNFFPDASELFCHPVPACKHGGFSNFKNSSHDIRSLVSKSLSQSGCKFTAMTSKEKPD